MVGLLSSIGPALGRLRFKQVRLKSKQGWGAELQMGQDKTYLLLTNRQEVPFTRFRLVAKSTTLDDLEWLNRLALGIRAR